MTELKKYRIQNDFSQIEMAQKLEVSINAYINWERGVMNPNDENQIKIDKLLNKGVKQNGTNTPI